MNSFRPLYRLTPEPYFWLMRERENELRDETRCLLVVGATVQANVFSKPRRGLENRYNGSPRFSHENANARTLETIYFYVSLIVEGFVSSWMIGNEVASVNFSE